MARSPDVPEPADGNAVTSPASAEGGTEQGRATATDGGDLSAASTTIDSLMRAVGEAPAVDVRVRLALREGGMISRFTVDRVLGEGGMGVVVAAHDPTLDRKVAIKLLRAADASQAARTRLVREAQAAARVEHDNVIAIHEVSSHGDHVFVVMELVDGDTLGKWQRGRPWREVLDAYIRAGRGLAAAHHAALVHRDFKPDNVLIGRDGRLRVTDFGLVAASGTIFDEDGRVKTDSQPPAAALQVPLTRTGDVMGTPAYMSPEQYRGEPADARADQFSFCVALWEGLYGLRPFDAGSLGERQERIKKGELAGPLAGRAVPARFDAILRRGLAFDPAARWPDMDALLAALEDDPEARRAKRRRALIGGGVVAVIAAGAAVAGVLALGGGAGEPVRPCRGLERELDGVWDSGRRGALEQALAATGKPYAAATATRVVAALDEHAGRLTAARIETCEATAVLETQSAEMLDRRMSCLDRRRSALAATVDLLVTDAAATLPRAVDAVMALPGPEACAADRLLDDMAPPADPNVQAAIARVRVDLDKASALSRAGRWKDVVAPAEAAVTGARAVGWPPLLAETLGIAAKARLITGDADGAEKALHEAIAAASSAKDVFLHGQLTVSLVEVANRQSRYADVETLAALADATLGTREDRWAERATLEAERGRAARAQNKLDDARAHLEKALALRVAHAGAESTLAARSLQDLANLELTAARFAEAEALLKRALAIVMQRSGPEHPDVAITLARLAVAAKELGRLDESAAGLRRAIEIMSAAEGELSPTVATSWANLGVVLGAQDKGEESLAAYQKAVAVREKVLPPDHPDLASSIMNVGIALQENLGRPADAVPYFERARDILKKKLGPDHPTLAHALHGLGSARLELKQAAAAVPDLEEAYRIRSGDAIDPRLKAESGYMLARALWDANAAGTPGRARAAALARETRKVHIELGLTRDEWLESHGR